jgi:hypothetical protein
MDRISELFLQALKTALEDRQVSWGEEVTGEELCRVFALAQEHHVQPMIFESAYACPAAAQLDPAVLTLCRRNTVQTVMAQTVKTQEFLELSQYLRQENIRPLVVKGIVCRNLYPKPDYRFSGDEDVLCGEAQFKKCHKAMITFGMEPCSSTLDSYEVPYRKADGSLYIELHKTLFSQDSDIFSDCNRLFDHAFDQSVDIEINGTPVSTLGYTDHMLYLILHAFKHFLHSGFGIRQVCDMVLFANAYGQRIDWKYILKKCQGVRAEKFAAAIFEIGRKYLNFDAALAHYPRFWREISVEIDPILEDLLCGGIYGASDRSRVHSSNMTLHAVSADKKGRKSKGDVFFTIFPPAKSLESRFPYLHRRPYLLPFAWICRIFAYIKECFTEPSSAASEVIRTGERRVELLRQYDIID